MVSELRHEDGAFYAVAPSACKSRTRRDLSLCYDAAPCEASARSAVWIVIAAATVGFGVPAILAAFVPPRGRLVPAVRAGLGAHRSCGGPGIRVRVLHPERLRQRGELRHRGQPRELLRHPRAARAPPVAGPLPGQAERLPRARSWDGRSRRPASFRSTAATAARGGDRRRGVEARCGGRSLVIFPEETRTRTGELLPFKKGAALLALRSGLPLLPVGIAGTRRPARAEPSRSLPRQVAISRGRADPGRGPSSRERGESDREAAGARGGAAGGGAGRE